MTCVVGIDPGKMTGISHLHNLNHEHRRLETWQLARVDVINHVRGLILSHTRRLVVVSERFIISQRTIRGTPQYDALELIGSVRDLCADFGHVEFHLQSASDAKRVATNDRLRHLGWYRTGLDHANDASRHVWLALIGLNSTTAYRLMNPGTI